jgi:hypothetical protein
VAARPQPGGEQAACFVAVDGAAPLPGGVAVSGVDLDGPAAAADAEFDDPLRRRGPVAPALFLFGLPLEDGGDLAVDALQPHRVPHPEGVQALQVGRQVIEHFWSRFMIRVSRARVFEY